MTPGEFVTWATGYYGPWPEGMRGDIREYLVEKEPAYLAMLKTVLLETIPTRIGQVNGYPPDISIMLEKAELVGRRIDAEIRHQRELDYAATMLPAPEPEIKTYGDLVKADWGQELARRISDLARAKSFK